MCIFSSNFFDCQMREVDSWYKRKVNKAIRKQIKSTHCYETAKEADPERFPPIFTLNTMAYDKILCMNSFVGEETPIWKPEWPDEIKKSTAPGANEWNTFTILGFHRSKKEWLKVPPTANPQFKGLHYLYYKCFFTQYDITEEQEPALILHCYTLKEIPDKLGKHFMVLIPAKQLTFCMAGFTYSEQAKYVKFTIIFVRNVFK